MTKGTMELPNIFFLQLMRYPVFPHDALYIIDYHKRGFLYVSGNPLFLCGEKPGDVEKMGYEFYQKYVMPKDLPMLLEINTADFNFYYEIDGYDRLNYFISYDFHLIHPNGRQILINHKLTPLVLDREKNIWLALCVVKPSTAKNSGNIFITGGGKRGVYHYDLKKQEWEKVPGLRLSLKEKEILLLSTQGYSTDEIARELSVTSATIKFHRKNIFICIVLPVKITIFHFIAINKTYFFKAHSQRTFCYNATDATSANQNFKVLYLLLFFFRNVNPVAGVFHISDN